MTEAANFLKHLREHPDDEAARGVFADWLEEHGREGDAERVPCWAHPTCKRTMLRAEVGTFPLTYCPPCLRKFVLAAFSRSLMEPSFVRTPFNPWQMERELLTRRLDGQLPEAPFLITKTA